MMQYSGGRDQHVCAILKSTLKGQLPAALPERRPGSLFVEADQPVHAVLLGDLFKVRLNFIARGQVPGPVGIAFESEGVVM